MISTDKFYDYDVQIVGVINYELAFRRSYITHISNFTLMLDESSLISNEGAKRSKFVLKLKPESVVLLSGTPTAGEALAVTNREEQEVEKINHKVIQSFRLLVDLAGFEIVGRVTLKHKKSGKVFK